MSELSHTEFIYGKAFCKNWSRYDSKIWVHDFPQNVIFTLLVAIISYELFEKRLLNIKKKFKSTSEKDISNNGDETPYNSTYKKLATQWLNEALCFVSSSVLAESFVLRNRQLLVAANRYMQLTIK